MKPTKTGLTMIELLIVLGIIALLVGLLVPALTTVRNIAKETKQKAQFSTIEMALVAFKNDYGDYPFSESYSRDTLVNDYCGAQKLAEALVGRDLLGFHPDSTWSATDPTYYPPSPPGPTDDNLRRRKGPYLELASTNVFRLGMSDPSINDGLFANTGDLAWDRNVLCDVFGVKEKKVTVITPITLETHTFSAGTPILYYKANTSSKRIEPPGPYIYDPADNEALIMLGRRSDGMQHNLSTHSRFIQEIMDPKASTDVRPWPYRPDSYILISAGVDGLYGTDDDITNFGN